MRIARHAVIAFVLLLTGIPAAVGAQGKASPTIEILNPSDGISMGGIPELSISRDTNERYHLSAWASRVPTSASARFTLIDSTGSETILGSAGPKEGNTFELFTNLCAQDGVEPDCRVAAGEYTLRATLLRVTGSGETIEVDSDELQVTVDPTTEEAQVPSQSVELIDPNNTGPLGVFYNDDGVTAVIIDAVGSRYAHALRGFYSTSVPGSEPVWQSCGDYVRQEGVDRPDDLPPGIPFYRVRCILDSSAYPTDVTAVAVVANGTRPGQVVDPAMDDGTDAHRISPYLQTVTALKARRRRLLELHGECLSPPLDVVALDQRGALISGVNVDIHAIGPNDFLTFGFDDRVSTAFQPPDAGPAHHEEVAFDCDDDGPGHSQGEHDKGQRYIPGERLSDADIKHIESVSGTDEGGRFIGVLHSSGAGRTFVVAWADTDDDDRRCEDESHITIAVYWRGDIKKDKTLPPMPPEAGPGMPGPCPAPRPTR